MLNDPGWIARMDQAAEEFMSFVEVQGLDRHDPVVRQVAKATARALVEFVDQANAQDRMYYIARGLASVL